LSKAAWKRNHQLETKTLKNESDETPGLYANMQPGQESQEHKQQPNKSILVRSPVVRRTVAREWVNSSFMDGSEHTGDLLIDEEGASMPRLPPHDILVQEPSQQYTAQHHTSACLCGLVLKNAPLSTEY